MGRSGVSCGPVDAAPKKILVVEDSAAMRALVASTLESVEGVSATETASGYEALKLIPRERFDLIITDINMPEINGLELIRFIRSRPEYQDVPLVIISTESSERDRERGLELGASAYFTKPFEPQALLETVRELLGAGDA
ncbi:MAG: response regulator [Deltaproteobacteria bacterium]|nr:MAG: response regulator [Deltaproteobacteria bacterium]